MYTDKDAQGNISIMEISPEEARDICSILFEFEGLVKDSAFLPEREQGRLAMISAKLRFLLIDALK
jgi:hypothetical protein